MRQLTGIVFNKEMSLLALLKEYFINYQSLPTSYKQNYFLCILSGQGSPRLTNDKRRLLSAKKLAKQIIKSKAKVKIFFCGYKESKKETLSLLKKNFPDFKNEIIANKSFRKTNTQVQIKTLINRFKGNKKVGVIIITDNWHCPRVKKYLKLYGQNYWQVYAEKAKLAPLRIMSEFIKTIQYYHRGDLQI